MSTVKRERGRETIMETKGRSKVRKEETTIRLEDDIEGMYTGGEVHGGRRDQLYPQNSAAFTPRLYE